MKIGFDLDGTITDNVPFFATLSQLWNDDVYVITFRDEKNRQKTIDELKEYGIRYTKLFIVHSFEEKAVIIRENNIQVYWDDMPEMLKEVGEECAVCLFRNPGNFDFDDQKWMFSKKTAKLLC